MTHPMRIAGLLAVALVAIAGTTQLADATDVGVTAAVNPKATGTPPDGTMRVLEIGNDILFKERIQTEGEGQTQILFVDQSALTIGPDSDIVIDEFVYDPATSSGKMAVSVGAGVLRFVGGKITQNEDTIFRTPHATIGIRGSSLGMKVGDVSQSFRTSGRMFCEKDDKLYVVLESGWMCEADANGLDLKEVPEDWMRRYIAAFSGDETEGDPTPEEIHEKIAADCGSNFAANAQRCGDILDEKEFDPRKTEESSGIDDVLDDLKRDDGNYGGGYYGGGYYINGG